MKHLHIFGCLLVIALLGASVFDAQARRYNNHPGKQSKAERTQTNSVPTTNAVPAVKEQRTFKDVAIDSTFYFAADKDKHFPRTKISDSTAKNQKDGTVGTISPGTPVLGEKTKAKDKDA